MSAAASFLKRFCSINLDDMVDFDHGEWNCMRAALKQSGLWGHMLVFAVVANVDYGPFQQDNFQTLKGAWA